MAGSPLFLYPVYAIYPGPQAVPGSPGSVIRTLCEAGVGAIQVRVEGAGDQSVLATARTVVTAARPWQVPVLINDRADIALLAGAAGVHLGQTDLPVEAARALLGPDAVVGVSVDTAEEALRAQADGADYVSLGPAYPTTTKSDVPPPRPLDLFARLASGLRVPLVAIGGIGADNAAPLARAGVAALAVVSWLYRGGDPAAQVRGLTRVFEEGS
jgi:thiamine-phosphate diphosphorylase